MTTAARGETPPEPSSVPSSTEVVITTAARGISPTTKRRPVAVTTPTAPRATTVASWRADATCSGLQEVDLGKGTARQVNASRATRLAWGPDRRSLVYVRPSSGRYDTLVAVLDTVTGAERVLRDTSRANYGAPQWSPDGQKVMVVEDFTADAAPGAVLSIDVGSGAATTIRKTSPSDPVSDLALSPDGRRVVFGRADTSIRMMNADGTGEREVVGGIRRTGRFAWSPNSEEVAYATNSAEGGMFVLAGDGTSTRKLGPTQAAQIAWSPLGNQLVASVDGQVTIVERGSGSARALTAGADPTWSPDGNAIAFTRYGPQQGTPERPDQKTDILVIGTDGVGSRVVIDDVGAQLAPPVLWSLDGDRLWVVCR